MRIATVVLFYLMVMTLVGCTPDTPLVPTQTLSPLLTPAYTQAPTQILATAAPEFTPAPAPRTLNICLGSQPETLYPYGSDMLAKQSVLEAVFDGPFDRLAFSVVPVILEKLPNLADGDAQIQQLLVQEGDLIINDNGKRNILSVGDVIRPSGCQSHDCAISYSGDQVEMDQMVVTFTLLENLKWSDGAPLTASDSVYSFRLDADTHTPSDKYLINRTASYETVNERTTRWIGLPGFLDQTYFLNFWTPYPQHIWAQYTAGELVDAEVSSRIPVGWGPYKIEEWKSGEYIRLSRNPNYFRSMQGLPKFDQLFFYFVGDTPERSLSMLLTGECDILDQDVSYSLKNSGTITDLQARDEIAAHFSSGSFMEIIDFSLLPAPAWQGLASTGAFLDTRLRQAVALCLDRQRVVNEVFLGHSFVPDSYLPPMHPLHNSHLPGYEFDVNAGSALLDEIGWVDDDNNLTTPRIYQGEDAHIPPGTALSFSYTTTASDVRDIVTAILAESLAQCGIQAVVQQLDPALLFDESPNGVLFGRNFDIAEFTFDTGNIPPCDRWLTENIPGDPTLTDIDGNLEHPLGWSGMNFPGFNNSEFELACRNALSLLPGQTGYTEANLEAQEIFARELPSIPLFMIIKLAVTRPDMCGFIMDPSADSEMWNIENFDYGLACSNN